MKVLSKALFFLAFSSEKQCEKNMQRYDISQFLFKKKLNTVNSITQGNFWITITKVTS